MALPLAGNDLARSTSGRGSWASSTRRSFAASGSFREAWQTPPDVFSRSGQQREHDDEEELRWDAIERLPAYDRLRKCMLQQVLDDGQVVHGEIDVRKLKMEDKKQLMDNILKVVEEDNEKFLRSLRDRTDRVGIEIPKIEVRFEQLSVEGDVFIGSRALPTLFNVTINTIERVLGFIRLAQSKKRKLQILKDISGIIKPSRMTLLLGPPGAGKTTLLLGLADKLNDDLRMTVRETLDFSGRCLGVGTRYEMLAELARREKGSGINPDPEIDAFMKATALAGQETSVVTDYILKVRVMKLCTGEMLVGPAKALFMDEISTGLDSSTTFQIVKYMRQMVHIMDVTMLISLLQPAPETYDLFDDIILLSEGQIVYQGPRDDVLEFFEYMGFKCPDRKGVADFLQEVTSKKDQEQYWYRKEQPYQFVSVPDFVEAFKSFRIGDQLINELREPYDKSKAHPAALVTEKYGIPNWELFKACFAREWLLMKRNSFVYVFKTTQITIMSLIAMTVFLRTQMPVGTVEDGGKFFGALFFSLINVMFNGMAELAMTVFRLPVFYKQRDFLFYPPWAFALPIWVLRIPLSFLESGIWIILTYYTIGFAPAAGRQWT
ncbi:hypothetical protein CDL15_Pgr003279 [Punica granatum]|uniref:ABC transporter domain-containing protein n=1 Tax=Punica granatum TaxID=22663 RepID=A0A218X2R9_PUNGR|nr:hypothetical protein CDL15_Pgr003279 [Punica granatum]